MHWEWRGMAANFVYGKPWILGNKTPRNVCPIHSSPTIFTSSCSWSSVGRFLHVFLHFPSSFHGRKSIFVLHSRWEEEIHDLGVYGGRFCPYKAHKHFLKSNFLSQSWFPIYHFVFCRPQLLRLMETPSWASHYQNVFLHTQHLCFAIMCILVLVWTVSKN